MDVYQVTAFGLAGAVLNAFFDPNSNLWLGHGDSHESRDKEKASNLHIYCFEK